MWFFRNSLRSFRTSQKSAACLIFPNYDSPDIFYFDTVSSKIRFRFSNDSDDESLAIKQFIIQYSERENR